MSKNPPKAQTEQKNLGDYRTMFVGLGEPGLALTVKQAIAVRTIFNAG
jgi:hypothetical protein